MYIKIRDDKKIEIDMIKQLKEAIEWLGKKLENSASSPANKKLFTSNDDAQQLNDEKSELFHSIVAKFLFIYQRVRPDTEPTVAYLCTRVSKSTIDVWKKLRRLVSFLKGTGNDKRIIGAIPLEHMDTWIDTSYGVYNDMRSQTGGAISLGWGIIHEISIIQKLNTKSSTESEVVGFSDYLPHNI